MLKTLSATALLSLVAATATAGETYVGIGTTGLEVGWGQALSERSGIRIDAEFLSYKRNFSTNDTDYDAKLKFGNVGVFYDYFMGSTFRLTGGALIGQRKLDGTGRPTGGVININGTSYPAAGESLTLDARFPTVSPYLGLGWGHKQASNGPAFFFDLGAAIGRPKVKLTATPGLVALAGQSNIDAEQSAAQDKADKFRVFPVVKLGFGYSF
jgi:hypothetical protein